MIKEKHDQPESTPSVQEPHPRPTLSGFRRKRRHPYRSGHEFATRSGSDETACEEEDIWDEAARDGFRLAPRIYNLELGEEAVSPQGPAMSGPLELALQDLPIHLVFREDPSDYSGPLRQSWHCDESRQWHWRLTVESGHQGPTAILTATPRKQALDREALVWRGGGSWRFFGTNRLQPDGRPGPSGVAIVITTP